MVSATRTWYRILQKIFALLSIIGGLLVILACSYTLYSLSSPEDTQSSQLDTNSTGGNETIEKKNTIKFDELPGKLRTTILACSIAAIVGSLCQVFSSIFVLSMCTKRFGDRPKWWLACHALSLALMLTCFFIPMSFHPENGDSLQIRMMGHSIHSHFREILNLESMKHFLKDLHVYLIVMAINGVLVMLLLGVNLACMCCGLKPYEDIDDNQSNIGLNDRSQLVKPYSRYD